MSAKVFVPLTLVFPLVRGADGRAERVLLGYKKRGFAAHKFNGYGGKLEPGETVEEAAVRELKEESMLDTPSLRSRGQIEFEFEGDPKILVVHIYETEVFTGTPGETEEMRPQWYDADKLPFDSMWADDRIWLPKILATRDGKVSGKFLFRGHDTILHYDLNFA